MLSVAGGDGRRGRRGRSSSARASRRRRSGGTTSHAGPCPCRRARAARPGPRGEARPFAHPARRRERAVLPRDPGLVPHVRAGERPGAGVRGAARRCCPTPGSATPSRASCATCSPRACTRACPRSRRRRGARSARWRSPTSRPPTSPSRSICLHVENLAVFRGAERLWTNGLSRAVPRRGAGHADPDRRASRPAFEQGLAPAAPARQPAEGWDIRKTFSASEVFADF